MLQRAVPGVLAIGEQEAAVLQKVHREDLVSENCYTLGMTARWDWMWEDREFYHAEARRVV